MKLKNIAAAVLVPLNILLLFFLIFETRLVVPSWLQVLGRMHPLVLHFPIVLILLYIVLVLFIPRKYKAESLYGSMVEWVLLFACLTTAVTALMGLLLSKEQGYDAGSIAWHKYTGALTSFILFIIYTFHSWLKQRVMLMAVTATFIAMMVIWAGHLGGDITHGENFILAPVTPEDIKPRRALEDAVIYTDLIEPILQAKCMGCHNSKKAKGQLVMETKELLLKGGKNGKLWDTTAAEPGLLWRRIHLPLEEKEHMPPVGKPQLTDDEAAIIYAWIKSGANFKQPVIALAPTDTLRILASKILKQSTGEQYDFAAADEKQIRKLNNNNRVITALAITSPALAVTFYNRPFYNTKQLEELKSLSVQIVELNLDNMPVKDEDIKIIAQFKNLRKLNLNATSITGNTLGELKDLLFLKSLSLSGTAVQPAQLNALSALPKLKTVYLWNTAVAANDLQRLQQQNKNIQYQTGFTGDTVVLKLLPPILQNEKIILTAPVALKLKQYINGTVIRFTTDGTEPDSLHSPVYKDGAMINGTVLVRAKAYKPGWITSDMMEANFYKSTYIPDSVIFILPPDSSYMGEGKMLVDLVKGETNYGLGNWLAWRKTKMETLMQFAQPTTIQSITLSVLVNVGAYIMPPASIEIWGGDEPKKLKLLGHIAPQQPTKMESPYLRGFECKFNPSAVKFIKVIATPVAKLPKWHPGKNDKAWVFIDEVLMN